MRQFWNIYHQFHSSLPTSNFVKVWLKANRHKYSVGVVSVQKQNFHPRYVIIKGLDFWFSFLLWWYYLKIHLENKQIYYEELIQMDHCITSQWKSTNPTVCFITYLSQSMSKLCPGIGLMSRSEWEQRKSMLRTWIQNRLVVA